MASKHAGGPTGGMEYSKGYKRKMARRRRKEEAAWKAKNGPVTVRRADGLGEAGRGLYD